MLSSPGHAMDYSAGEFLQAGYQSIDGIPLGYLQQVDGTRMFALTQVFSHLLKDLPRAAVSQAMERLHIQSRRCDLRELRTLKAIQSVPTRAVKGSLISKTDLEALCAALAPRRRKRRRRRRRRKGRRREPGGDLLLPAAAAAEGAFRAGAGGSAKRDALLLSDPCARGGGERAAPPARGYPRSHLLAEVLRAYPSDLQLLHPAGRERGCGGGPSPPQLDGGCPKRSACGCPLGQKGRPAVPFAGAKRQGTSAGYSSDSDSSGPSSPATSSESSDDDEEEEEEEEEEEDSSTSSEEGSSSGSESSSLCSGDSVQSTRYRQAALPRLPPPQPAAAAPALPSGAKALRPEPDLLFWARTLRAPTLESFPPLPAKEALGEQEPAQYEAGRPAVTRPASPRPPPPPEPRGHDSGEDFLAEEALGLEQPPPQPEGDSPGGSGSGREAQFDRLIRQSKLWCYAKGFSADGKGLRRAEQAKGTPPSSSSSSSSSSAPKAGLLSFAHKPLKGGHDVVEKCAKRGRAEQERQPGGAGNKASKLPRKTPKKAGGPPPCKRLPGPSSTPVWPARSPFTLMGAFPCTPALVVGSDGDLCPASSLCVKDSCALARTHPLWTWQLGGNAVPVPPSLKFRGYNVEEDL